MSRPTKTGRVLQSGRIRAAEIAGALGLGGPEPETRAPKLTPAQARAKAEGKPLPPSPPDFEQTVIAGGRDAWEFLGKPALEAPPGSPDGTPVPVEPPPKPSPQRTNWDAIDGPPKLDAAEAKPDAARVAAEAEAVVGDIKAHAERARAELKAAIGTPGEAAAIKRAQEAAAFVERAGAKL